MVMPQAMPDSMLFTSDFDTGIDADWGSYNNCNLSTDNGRMKATVSSVWGTSFKQFSTTTGKQYRVRFTIDMGNCTDLHVPVYKFDHSSYVTLSGVGISVTASGTYEGTFTATANVMLLLFEMIPGVNPPPDSTGYYWLDNVSVEEVKPVDSTLVGKGGYRYGFNGQEKSTEINGSENLYTAEFWEYDSRIGRRWNRDPVKRPWQSDYACLSNNPILRADPKGDDDYTIDKQGHINLTKKTDAKNNTIFNSDGSKSTTVGLDFFKQKFEGSSGSGKGKKENTIIVGRNLKDMEKAYKFFADNSNVEWQYNIYENKSKVGSLASSHTDGGIENYAELAFRVIGKNANIKLLYSSHSHPGTYDSKTGWPAYPSGYTYQLKPDLANPGDRDNYQYYKDNFKDRIPSMFNIYIVGKPMLEVEYNDKVVNRGMSLPAIIISPQTKKK